MISGVSPVPAFASFTSSPYSSSFVTISERPCRAAAMSGVSPAMLIVAPAAARRRGEASVCREEEARAFYGLMSTLFGDLDRLSRGR